MTPIQQIQSILDESNKQARSDGIMEGYEVARRIFIWYASNHQLKNPNSLETLEKWAMADLERLKIKAKG